MRLHQYLTALSVIICTSTAAIAGTVEIIPSVVARFDEFFSPLSFTSPPGGAIVDGPGIYQIDFEFEVSNLTGDETCFGCAAFDIELSDGLGDTIGWQPDVSQVDPPGVGPLVPKWSSNGDIAPGDPLSILFCNNVAGPIQIQDERLSLGENGPEFFGSLYVQWDGVGLDTLTIANLEFNLASPSPAAFSPAAWRSWRGSA